MRATANDRVDRKYLEISILVYCDFINSGQVNDSESSQIDHNDASSTYYLSQVFNIEKDIEVLHSYCH